MLDQVIVAEEALPDLYSVEAEEAAVGSVLIAPDLWGEVSSLDPQAFHIIRNQWIWAAFKSLHEQCMPIDIQTVGDELQRKGQLEEIGGRACLTKLLNRVPNAFNVSAYADTILQLAERRKLVAKANQIAASAYDLSQPIPAAQLTDPSKYSTWADMDTGPIEWAWPGWLVNGLLTLLVSYSG